MCRREEPDIDQSPLKPHPCLEVVELQGNIQPHIRIPKLLLAFNVQLVLHLQYSVTRHGRQQRPTRRRARKRYVKRVV